MITGPVDPVVAHDSERGFSMIEVVVALALLSIVAAGLLAMASLAMIQAENQGHLGARTAEYAQDKMEQLLVLAYGDQVSDTRVFPAATAGGTGLAVGGSVDPANPVAGYVDYLDISGNLLPSVGAAGPQGWFYQRAWEITQVSGTLKQVRVTATVARSIANRQRPQTTLTTLKTFPF
jgi:prepilin-type N-terminal cleavage/methylation domain-containing protein